MTHNAHDGHLLDNDDQTMRRMMEEMSKHDASLYTMHQLLDGEFGSDEGKRAWRQIVRSKLTDTKGVRENEHVVRLLSRYGMCYLTKLRHRDEQV